MKILALSDIHIDLTNSKTLKKLDQIIDVLAEKSTNVLVVWGDIGKTKAEIVYILERLKKFKWKKLAYLWNHEARAIEQSTLNDDWVEELSRLFFNHDFHLLDKEPCVVDRVGFIGNIGWYDGTLYHWGDFSEVEKQHLEWYGENYNSWWITPRELLKNSISKIQNHLEAISDKCDKIVLGIHYIWFPEFVLYGYSPEFDKYSYGMGSELLGKLYTSHHKIVLGFCGHSHRSGVVYREGVPIYNISHNETQPYLEITV